jgi:hypothetical protein
MCVRRPTRAVLVAALLCGGVSSPGEGQSCACPDPLDAQTPPGVVWQGSPEGMQLSHLAHLLAPVLWFSSDEPMLVLRPDAPIPHAHPCDRESATPVVYY